MNPKRYVKTDEFFMRRAIQLALKGEGLTSPNPIVGAVIVRGGKIVGEGCHQKCGLAHAEVNALCDAGRHSNGATLFVTLEPCDHFGRTPPCTDAIISSGIKKVVIGAKDPNPINNGHGISRLEKSGIKTVFGVLEEDASAINMPYIKFITKKMPYVTVKIAESLDGKIATRMGESRWITGEDSRRYVHRLRGRVDAVMAGVGTIIKDNPRLTNRLGSRQPVRIVVDSCLRTPPGAKIFSDIKTSQVIIATTKNSKRAARYVKMGAEVLVAGSRGGKVDLRSLFKGLARRGISNVLVEGGGNLVAGLVEERLVDKFLFFIAPKIIGGRSAVTSVEGRGAARIGEAMELRNIKIKRFAKDILIEAEAG